MRERETQIDEGRERKERIKEKDGERPGRKHNNFAADEVGVARGDAQHAGPIVLSRLPRHPGCFLFLTV